MAFNTQTDAQSLPLQEMRVELLRGCPLLCTHCSAHAAPHHPLQLPLERALTLIDEFAELGGQGVTLTGGEPLTYPGLEAVLRRCREWFLRVRLFSSGIVFDQNERVAAIRILDQCAPFIDSVAFSIYAADPNIHDTITSIPGSLYLTLAAVRHTVALGLDVDMHFVPTRLNYRNLPVLVELAARLRVPRIVILRFVPHGRGKSKEAELSLDMQAHHWLRDTILELRGRYPSVILYVGSAYNILGLDAPCPCTAGVQQLVIEADGRIAPCSAFGNFHVREDGFDNILQHPLRVVWERSLYLERVRHALRMVDVCSGCLAQKTVLSGRIDPSVQDPLAELAAS